MVWLISYMIDLLINVKILRVMYFNFAAVVFDLIWTYFNCLLFTCILQCIGIGHKFWYLYTPTLTFL